MSGNVEVQDAAPSVLDDEEAVGNVSVGTVKKSTAAVTSR